MPQIVVKKYSELDADHLSSVAYFGSIVGGVLIAPIADKYFQRRLKSLIIVFSCFALLLGLGFALNFETPIAELNHLETSIKEDTHKRKFPFAWLLLIMAAKGFFQGAIVPISYELCADISFPTMPTFSSTLYTFCSQVGQCLFTFMPMFYPVYFYTIIMSLAMFAMIVSLCLMTVPNRRLDFEELHTRTGSRQDDRH